MFSLPLAAHTRNRIKLIITAKKHEHQIPKKQIFSDYHAG